MIPDYLNDWSLWKLKGLHRCCKSTGFFKHPRAVIELRDLIKLKEETDETETA